MVGAGKLRSCPPLASAETLFRFASVLKQKTFILIDVKQRTNISVQFSYNDISYLII